MIMTIHLKVAQMTTMILIVQRVFGMNPIIIVEMITRQTCGSLPIIQMTLTACVMLVDLLPVRGIVPGSLILWMQMENLWKEFLGMTYVNGLLIQPVEEVVLMTVMQI